MTEEPNRAYEPVPPEPQEKQYKVTGEQTVLDHKPGEEFAATLSFEQEKMFTEYGHLEVVETEPEAEADSSGEGSDDSDKGEQE